MKQICAASVFLLPSESFQDQAIPVCLFLCSDQTVLFSVSKCIQKLDLKGLLLYLILFGSVKVSNTSTLEKSVFKVCSTAALERAGLCVNIAWRGLSSEWFKKVLVQYD